MKKIFIIISLFLFHNAHAENVIYKCTSDTGEITYQNNSGDRHDCNKTNFASYPSINFFKPDAPKKFSNNTSSANSVVKEQSNSSSNVSEEQRVRDGKRVLILGQELSQEKEQLTTVSEMLKNLKEATPKDSAQIAQLEELKLSHINNITAIDRELGNTKVVQKSEELKIEKANLQPNLNNETMMVTTAIKPSSKKSLPISLPETLPLPLPVPDSTSAVVKTSVKKVVPVDSLSVPITNNNSEKPVLVKRIKPSSEAVKEVVTDNIPSIDKRKNNSLGTTMSSSSGLSKMSKVKE